MGAFQGLREASRSFSSNLLGPGKYVVRIDSCDEYVAQQKGQMWKTTLTVLAVVEGKSHKPGEQVHVFYKVGQYPELFLQNIKAFLAGVLNVSDDQIGAEEADAVCAEKGGPLDGAVTTAMGREQATKNGRDDEGNRTKYVKHSWAPALNNDEILEALGEEAVARFFPNGLGG